MVRGFGIAVTAVALIHQCAEITRMARGRGTDAPRLRQARVYRLISRAFIGLPWPMNAAGIFVEGATGSVGADIVMPPSRRILTSIMADARPLIPTSSIGLARCAEGCGRYLQRECCLLPMCEASLTGPEPSDVGCHRRRGFWPTLSGPTPVSDMRTWDRCRPPPASCQAIRRCSRSHRGTRPGTGWPRSFRSSTRVWRCGRRCRPCRCSRRIPPCCPTMSWRAPPRSWVSWRTRTFINR